MEKPGKWEWLEDANCASVGLDTFETTRYTPKSEIDLMKRICQQCLVAQKCLEFALEFDDDNVSGGLTKSEREKYKQGELF